MTEVRGRFTPGARVRAHCRRRRLRRCGQQRPEPGEVALSSGGREAAGELPLLLAGCPSARAPLLNAPSRSRRELAHIVRALADDLGNPWVVVVEHVVEQEHGALLRRQAVQHHQHRRRQRVGHLRLLSRMVGGRADGRLRQPLADVSLAPDPRRSQLVDRQTSREGDNECARQSEPLTVLERSNETKQRLLDQVLSPQTLPSIL